MKDEQTLRMSMREVDRLKVIDEVLIGRLKRRQAGEQLGLSKRQIIRLCKRVRKEGNRGVIHRLRGRESNHRLSAELVERAVGVVREEYRDFGPTFANEKLKERHGIKISVSVLRRGMIAGEIWRAKKRKVRHRAYRQRRACLGELVQLDGSEHDWFEGRAERCVLLIFIDDATSRILYGEFVGSEDTLNLMRTTKGYLETHGRPVAFYVDRDSIYKINRQATIEEQLRDSQPMTQFSRAMEQLNIQVIFAHSPQAKGRVERGFKTHQDRLVKELRINGISSIGQANKFLQEIYMPGHNARFAVGPANHTDAHRPVGKSHCLEQILSLRTERTLFNDFTVRFNNCFFQVLPDQKMLPRPKDKIFVEVRLDQSLHLLFKSKYLKFNEITKPPVKIQQMQTTGRPHKPVVPEKDHPWRRFQLPKQVWQPLNSVKREGKNCES